MVSARFCRAALLLAGLGVSVLTSSAPAHAQARNGNVYNGQRHEPSAPNVGNAEASAGVAAPSRQQQQENQELDQIGKQLDQRAKQDAKTPGIEGNYGVKPGGVVKIAP